MFARRKNILPSHSNNILRRTARSPISVCGEDTLFRRTSLDMLHKIAAHARCSAIKSHRLQACLVTSVRNSVLRTSIPSWICRSAPTIAGAVKPSVDDRGAAFFCLFGSVVVWRAEARQSFLSEYNQRVSVSCRKDCT